jgi:hypothetical protein
MYLTIIFSQFHLAVVSRSSIRLTFTSGFRVSESCDTVVSLHFFVPVISTGLYPKLSKRTKDPTDKPLTPLVYTRASGGFWSHAIYTSSSPVAPPVVFIGLTRYKTLCGVACSNLASSKTWASAVGLTFCHACF